MKKKQLSIKDLSIGAVFGGLVIGSLWLITTANAPKESANKEPEKYRDLLEEAGSNHLPSGAAEISAYYTTIEKETSLDGSEPNVTCSALVVLDGPKMLMDALTEEKYNNPPTVVIGSANSSWTGINTSTKNNPVKLLVTTNSMFEGDTTGCMSATFSSFIAVE
jgi:hypothetical protein